MKMANNLKLSGVYVDHDGRRTSPRRIVLRLWTDKQRLREVELTLDETIRLAREALTVFCTESDRRDRTNPRPEAADANGGEGE